MSLANIDLPLRYKGQVTLYGSLIRLILYLHCQTIVTLEMTFDVLCHHLFVSILLSGIGETRFYANLE